jgi:2-polyprenyl-3-methyl-5-hydroxy-6-metoxy-1,4-benzoquinol methylase
MRPPQPGNPACAANPILFRETVGYIVDKVIINLILNIEKRKNMIHKLSLRELSELTCKNISDISENNKDEMAIPSYLHKNPFVRWLMWERYQFISRLSNFSKEMTVLEFGCGIGVFLPELDKTCGRVYAIDLFPEYAKQLSSKLNLHIIFIDNMSHIPNNSLDRIVAADVLEHIPSVNEYLTIFHEKLKHGGSLIVSGPTENIYYKMGRILSGFGGKGGYHHTNINELIKAIGNSGFELIQLHSLPLKIVPLFKVCQFKKII